MTDIEKGSKAAAGEAHERNDPPFHAMSGGDVIESLGVGSGIQTDGLSTAEAKRRLEEYGPNQLSEKEKVTLLQRIWNQLNNVLVLILVTVAVVSAIRGATADDGDTIVSNWIQVGLIVGVITLNTCIGILQEGSAEKAAEALKAMLSSDAVLRRDGKEVKVPANEVVPGDIVILNTGDRVPADLRMLEVNNLACQEAALTGESVPVDKTVDPIDTGDGDPNQTPLGDRHNMCFSATLVSQGYGIGLVVNTGDHTEIGTINALVNKVKEKKTAVLKQIDTVSKWLAFFIVLTALVTFLVALLQTGLSFIDSLSISLVCAVAMIPEGLEAIVTLTYAWAVSNMAAQNAIIRALPAVETLGSVTVICSDKTGTLTKNEMSLTAFVTSNSRWKIDVNSRDRTPGNFTRDDTHLAERADHSKFRRGVSVIRDGPSAAGAARRGAKSKNFPYAMSAHAFESGHDTKNGSTEPEVSATKDKSPKSPVMGESADVQYLRTALAGGVLCSKCTLGENGGREGEIGNPTELSILRAAYFANIDVPEMKGSAPIYAEVPFSSEYKFMATVHESTYENDGATNDDKFVVHVKGAPDRMIPLCSHQARGGTVGDEDSEPIDTKYWTEQIAILSSHGLRVLALCRGSILKDDIQKGEQLGPEFVNERGEPWLTIVGLCAIMDPPRPECVDAVTEARGAGVRVAMITGDHRDTALAIGSMLGLVDEEHSEAVTGPELDAMDDDELRLAVMKYNVFARASPQNKIRIVKALQAEGEITSMTGDGVNDAPALKAADMGVAMGKEGTDVAREASQMILADDNFATIITAVREGRVVWDNLRKVLMVNTPINNAQGMSVLFGMICGLEDTPLTAIQVLYCNLICAVTLGFVTAVEPAEDGIMTKPPRRVGKRLIGRFLFLRIALGTIVLVAGTVGSVFWARDLGYELEQQRSQASNTLTFGAISITLSARFAYNSAIHTRLFTGNKYAWYSVLIVAVLQAAITYIPGLNATIFDMGPMDATQWGIVVLFMGATFFVMETEKAIRRYLMNLGEDTDDREYGFFDEHLKDNVPEDDSNKGGLLPKGASHLNLTELNR